LRIRINEERKKGGEKGKRERERERERGNAIVTG